MRAIWARSVGVAPYLGGFFWLDLGEWRDGWRGRLTFRNTPYLRCRTSGLPQVPL